MLERCTSRGAMRWAVCACLLTCAVPQNAAAAKPSAEVAQASEAKKLFTKGSELYVAKRYTEALQALKSSYQLVPSPNSGLLIARCLRDSGQAVEAQEMFSTVEVDARRRVADGEAKYGRTADAAAAEGAAVRASLGSIRIHIESPEQGTKLDIDGTPTPIPDDGNILVWHTPGDVTVSVHPPSGLDQKQGGTVRAGAEIKMAFERAEPTPPEVPVPPSEGPRTPVTGPGVDPGEHTPSPPTSGSSWARPAAWVAGVVTVAGAGLFAGFGLVSRSDYNELSTRCGPSNCTSASDRAEASDGKRYQTIANVALVVGSVAAAATLTFVIVAATSSPARTTSAVPLRLRVGATTLQLGGDF